MAKKLSVLDHLNNYEIFAKKTRIDHWNCSENSRFVTVKCTDVLKVVKTSSSNEADTAENYELPSPASPTFPARRRLKAALRSRNSNTESSNAANVTPQCVKDAEKKSITKDPNKPGTVEQLIAKVPSIENDFTIKKRIGFGTFSTVYLATRKKTDVEGDNHYYALKHICKASSNLKRVLFEAKCLKQIGGCENVVTLENIVRNNCEHVFVMPYCRADKFVNLIQEMSFDEVRDYMKQLLTALRRVHKFNVIHRDVKPSNFLYDMKNRRGVLVDFGLAHKANYYKTENLKKISSPPRMKSTPIPEINRAKPFRQITNTLQGRCSPLHTRSLSMVALAKSKNQNSKGIATRKRSAEDEVDGASKRIYTENMHGYKFPSVAKPSDSNKDPKLGQVTPIRPRALSRPGFETRGIPMFLPLPSIPSPVGNSTGSDRVFTSPSPAMCFSNDGKNLFNIAASRSKPRTGKTVGDMIPSLRKLRVESKLGKSSKPQIYKDNDKECSCNGKLICLQCNIRLSTTAPRAGTSGFRSPEVLIQCPHQTTAVDTWSAGIILLSLITGHYPFFKTTNDVESLAQIIALFGTEKIKQVARGCSKRLSMSYFCPGNDLKTVVETLRDVSGRTPDKLEKRTNSPFTSKSTDSEKSSHREIIIPPYPVHDIPQSTYDLLSGLLDVNPLTRLSAEQALEHQFFNEKSS